MSTPRAGTAAMRKNGKMLISKCQLVGICVTANPRSDYNLVTLDLHLWPWELFSYFWI